MMVIEPVPCLKDNYAYLVFADDEADAVVVDPSQAAPVAAALAARRRNLRGILATHHHQDHVGGAAALMAAAPGPVWFAAHEHDRGRIKGLTAFVQAPQDQFVPTDLKIGRHPLLAMHVPGHTRTAIAWALSGATGMPTDIFTGDTLFGAGCGRLFEGTPAEMFRSLRGLTAGSGDVRLWFGHEYTANNLRFATSVEPDNAAIAARLNTVSGRTTPTTVSLERDTNPFVRAATAQELAARRAAKDAF